MPPIPVHIDDPITPQKASGVTPQTTDSQGAGAAQVPTSTTDQSTSTYPAARPGAVAAPAPTSYIPNPAPAPTRTTAASHDGPPPPQPGAAPVAPVQYPPSVTSSTLPPPPKAGETAQLQTAATTTMPPQMGFPPPAQNYAPTHSTTTTAPFQGGPTTLNLGPVSSAHQAADRPAGYQQNLYAQEMSSAQRASLDEQDRREHAGGNGNGIAANLGLGGMSSAGGGGDANETVSNVWNAVKGWANTAGQRLAETEEEVWKRINSQK